MTGNYDPPYKTLFFVCYLTVAAIVATEAGLLGDSDAYVVNQSYDAFAFGNEELRVEISEAVRIYQEVIL